MNEPFVTTIKERCRMCYTCVRECPAKAIRIVTGQAEVIAERCIACGNCVQVCSQHAKKVAGSIEQVNALLASPQKTALCLAPSFPAEFIETDYKHLVGMLRALGFDLVQEVGFGADLVAHRYKQLVAESGEKQRTIATNCPAIVGYIERYFPNLVPMMAPIVSPMVATARVLRKMHGDDLKIIFAGPCIAKKAEAVDPQVGGEIDAVLTFLELRQMFESAGIAPETAQSGEFDPPWAGIGSLFPISRGMLQAGDIREDLLTGKVVATQGRVRVVEAIKEFDSGDLGATLLELLCCEGCIMGPGIENDLPLFNRRRRVREFVGDRKNAIAEATWRAEMDKYADLDLSRKYQAFDQRSDTPDAEAVARVMLKLGKRTPADELNCGACGYDTCCDHAVAICKGLAESEMCLPYTIEQLRVAIDNLASINQQLASTQEALVQSEKLASMGQLAAGIAHEVNNPLGIVLMYAHLLADSCDEQDKNREDLKMIAEQADRCKKIVAGLLHFARQNKVVRMPIDFSEIPKLSLHGIKLPQNVSLEIANELEDKTVEIDRDQIIQAVSNLVNNALAAMEPGGGRLRLLTSGDADFARISVADSGHGIPEENLSKIFEPFFTTKQMGKGTGLGLAVTYGIVKMHSGELRVESQADPAKGPTGSTFTITLPRNA